MDPQVHEREVYKLGALLGSVGHRVKIHKITSATGKDRGDIEIRDYVVLQKPQEQAGRMPPPRTLILDFTMTHTPRLTIKLDRLIVLSKSSLLGWFLHVSLIVIIKGRSPMEVSLIVIINQV